jgi:hypothetical protein
MVALKEQEDKQNCTIFCRPGQRNHCSGSLGAGWFGVPTAEGANCFFSLHQSRPALRPTQPSLKLIPGLLPPVSSDWRVALTTHPNLTLGLRTSGAVPLLPLCTSMPCYGETSDICILNSSVGSVYHSPRTDGVPPPPTNGISPTVKGTAFVC